MHCVYVLYSEKFNKIYVGCTSDLNGRFRSHNELSTKGYTVRFRPWKVIHTEHFTTKKEALVRERQLKSAAGRKFIWEIVSSGSGG
ncbi:MAG TPA: GIY-YIG nuclease family protein [Cyclobacteriaceae bacterium]|nr:GIY-YIG nuclease family protein [Cyclobacteriaceae bacterium]